MGRRSPKEHGGELSGKGERDVCAAFISTCLYGVLQRIGRKGSLLGLCNLIISSHYLLFKYLKSPQRRSAALLPAPRRVQRGESTVRSLQGLNGGGAKAEKRLNVGREKEKKSRAEVGPTPQLLCLVTFLQNMIVAG